MNREQMLAQLGLTSDEFTDLLQKYETFVNSLNESQKTVLAQSIPSLDAAAASFGGNVTPSDLEGIFGGIVDLPTVICIFFVYRQGNK